MLSWSLLLVCASSVLAALDKTHGVHPKLLSKYSPIKGSNPEQWRCLDDSKTIAWSAVNDDFCDCEDGSDEPGTSACPDSTFYCKNEGFMGSTIRSSRVNDGLCEVECCDGSDEKPGICPNRCKEIGEEYRTKKAAEMKLRKTGAKIRATYVAFAAKEKKRLDTLFTSTTEEVASKEKEVARLKAILERAESMSAADLERKQQSPLYQSLITHSNALKSLRREYEKLKENEKTLANILDALRSGYNPNYQDMAVLEAVRGWEFYAGLPHITEVGKESEGGENSESTEEKKEEEEEEQLEEGEWTKDQLENDLGALLHTDYVNLLLEHDQQVGDVNPTSLLFDIGSYIPDSLHPHYEVLRDSLVALLETLGVTRATKDLATDTSKARTSFQSAENDLRKAKREKENAEKDLNRLYDEEWFGKDGAWKKLDKFCVEKDTGEYTYEVCLFDEGRQKPNKGGQKFSLGKYHHWNKNAEVGTPEYYSRQYYKGGARCWNGPERSLTVDWSCGTENAILTVSEPEKCEYLFTATTPALCLPLDGSSQGKKEEL